jgi:hypothetical protein
VEIACCKVHICFTSYDSRRKVELVQYNANIFILGPRARMAIAFAAGFSCLIGLHVEIACCKVHICFTYQRSVRLTVDLLCGQWWVKVELVQYNANIFILGPRARMAIAFAAGFSCLIEGRCRL